MSLFDWLLVGHLMGDFLLQTDGMAQHKGQRWPWMLRHVAVYMVVQSVVLAAYALRHPLPLGWVVAAWVLICAAHVVLDRREFTAWWMRFAHISTRHSWLPIVVDQAFHLLSLAIVAQALVLVS